jgi:hypothetical protein
MKNKRILGLQQGMFKYSCYRAECLLQVQKKQVKNLILQVIRRRLQGGDDF